MNFLFRKSKKKKSKSDKMSTVEEDENEDTGITIKVIFVYFYKNISEGVVFIIFIENAQFFRLPKYHRFMAFVSFCRPNKIQKNLHYRYTRVF